MLWFVSSRKKNEVWVSPVLGPEAQAQDVAPHPHHGSRLGHGLQLSSQFLPPGGASQQAMAWGSLMSVDVNWRQWIFICSIKKWTHTHIYIYINIYIYIHIYIHIYIYTVYIYILGQSHSARRNLQLHQPTSWVLHGAWRRLGHPNLQSHRLIAATGWTRQHGDLVSARWKNLAQLDGCAKRGRQNRNIRKHRNGTESIASLCASSAFTKSEAGHSEEFTSFFIPDWCKWSAIRGQYTWGNPGIRNWAAKISCDQAGLVSFSQPSDCHQWNKHE